MILTEVNYWSNSSKLRLGALITLISEIIIRYQWQFVISLSASLVLASLPTEITSKPSTEETKSQDHHNRKKHWVFSTSILIIVDSTVPMWAQSNV